jgi:hypothetical protein
MMSRIRSGGNRDTELALAESEFSEIELVAREAEIFNDVGHDAARHVTRMPGKGDKAVGTERIRVVPVAPKAFGVVGRVFAHGSGGEDEFVAEGGGNGASGFEQGFEVGFGGLLKAEHGFTPVASMRVAAGKQAGFGDPHAILIVAELNFREWNDHSGVTLAWLAAAVKPGYG